MALHTGYRLFNISLYTQEFQCVICFAVIQTQNELRLHVENNHSNHNSGVICPEIRCRLRTWDFLQFQQHLILHHAHITYQHLARYLAYDVYVCVQCLFRTIYEGDIILHILHVHLHYISIPAINQAIVDLVVFEVALGGDVHPNLPPHPLLLAIEYLPIVAPIEEGNAPENIGDFMDDIIVDVPEEVIPEGDIPENIHMDIGRYPLEQIVAEGDIPENIHMDIGRYPLEQIVAEGDIPENIHMDIGRYPLEQIVAEGDIPENIHMDIVRYPFEEIVPEEDIPVDMYMAIARYPLEEIVPEEPVPEEEHVGRLENRAQDQNHVAARNVEENNINAGNVEENNIDVGNEEANHIDAGNEEANGDNNLPDDNPQAIHDPHNHDYNMII